MPHQSDGFALQTHIRSPDGIPATLMHDALVSLERDMRTAIAGGPVVLTEWITWARKTQQHTNALVRVLFLIIAINDMSADDVATLAQQFRATSTTPHRPPTPVRRPGPRQSPQLF